MGAYDVDFVDDLVDTACDELEEIKKNILKIIRDNPNNLSDADKLKAIEEIISADIDDNVIAVLSRIV